MCESKSCVMYHRVPVPTKSMQETITILFFDLCELLLDPRTGRVPSSACVKLVAWKARSGAGWG